MHNVWLFKKSSIKYDISDNSDRDSCRTHTRNVFSISIFNVGYEIKKKIIFENYHRGIPRSKENTKLSTVAGATVLDCRLSMFCLLVCCSFRFFLNIFDWFTKYCHTLVTFKLSHLIFVNTNVYIRVVISLVSLK